MGSGFTNVTVGAGSYPVFDGFEESRVSGKDIAAVVGVSPPTLSKWRRGRTRIPAAKLTFLTMLLANGLEELEDVRRLEGNGAGSGWLDGNLRAARRCLEEQEALNAELPPAAIHEGVRMFHDWWRMNAKVLRPATLRPGGTGEETA